MKNPNSPFRIMLRYSGYSSLVSLVIACYLFVTSTTVTQYLLAAVVLVLLLMLSIAIGFYVAMTAFYHREQLAEEYARFQLVNHYPERAAFERKMQEVDARASRLYKKNGRYA